MNLPCLFGFECCKFQNIVTQRCRTHLLILEACRQDVRLLKGFLQHTRLRIEFLLLVLNGAGKPVGLAQGKGQLFTHLFEFNRNARLFRSKFRSRHIRLCANLGGRKRRGRPHPPFGQDNDAIVNQGRKHDRQQNGRQKPECKKNNEIDHDTITS